MPREIFLQEEMKKEDSEAKFGKFERSNLFSEHGGIIELAEMHDDAWMLDDNLLSNEA
jgi:hypothetical protein